jgi:Uma2 family endonuclease
MKLPRSGREPDVIFLAQAHRDRLKDTYLDGPADLVVEVISPDSVTRDRAKKFAEYQQGGVAEYWLLDPDTQEAEFYQLDAQGTYQRVLPDAQGIYHSHAVPGFWLNAAWLWQSPEPSVDQVLQEIAGEAYARHLAAHADEAFARAFLAQLREQGKLPDIDP